MQLEDSPEAAASLDALRRCGLVTDVELDAVHKLEGRFKAEVGLAETIHLHIKVDDTHGLPLNEFFAAGARLDHQKDGFVKYRMPGGVNAIFSHIKVSQDELIETEATRRPRPFLDHIGIDLRAETAPVRQAFDGLPDAAEGLEWGLASQGGPDRPVYCCHVEVAEKHWLYPPDEAGHPGIPLEFAYGELKVNPDKSGCDLRPADPQKVDPASIPSCCGTSGGHAAPSGGAGYYDPADLGRFGEIGRTGAKLAEAFFGYYGQAMADGALTKREKALIALAVAHTLKCPYCIDATTSTLADLDASEAEMMEAVHVAGAMAAGVTLVHSVQMMKGLDARAAVEPSLVR